MLEMVDYYGGTVLILALAAVEVMAIAWIYGTNQITRDFNFMLNMQLSVYWRFCWGVLCPILLPLLFLYVLFTQAGVPNIPYPAQIAGWIISLIGQLNKIQGVPDETHCYYMVSKKMAYLIRYDSYYYKEHFYGSKLGKIWKRPLI